MRSQSIYLSIPVIWPVRGGVRHFEPITAKESQESLTQLAMFDFTAPQK